MLGAGGAASRWAPRQAPPKAERAANTVTAVGSPPIAVAAASAWPEAPKATAAGRPTTLPDGGASDLTGSSVGSNMRVKSGGRPCGERPGFSQETIDRPSGDPARRTVASAVREITTGRPRAWP